MRNDKTNFPLNKIFIRKSQTEYLYFDLLDKSYCFNKIIALHKYINIDIFKVYLYNYLPFLFYNYFNNEPRTYIVGNSE